jgi:restriction system protein
MDYIRVNDKGLYEVRVEDKRLNKFHVIKGKEKYIVEQKARALRAQWDATWKRMQEAEERRSARERQALQKEQKVKLAEQMTAEAEEEVAKAESTLKRSLVKDARVDWEQLKDHKPFPNPKPVRFEAPRVTAPVPVFRPPLGLVLPKAPEEPQKPVYPPKPTPPDLAEKPSRIEARFQPQLGFWDKLLPFRRQRRQEEAEAYFQEEVAVWTARVAEYKAAIEVYNQVGRRLSDSYKEKQRAYKAALASHATTCDRLKKEYQDRLDAAKRDYEREVARREAAESEYDREVRRLEAEYANVLALWNKERDDYLAEQAERNKQVDRKRAEYFECNPSAVVDYCDMVLSGSEYPGNYPQDFELEYIADSRTLLVEYYLPTLEEMPGNKGVKYVQTKDQFSYTPLSESARNKLYDDVVCQITLRSLYELFTADVANSLDAVVFNGRVRSVDKATGRPFEACILSVQVSKAEFVEINLEYVEPRACIKKLKGVASSKLHSMAPVAPIVQMEREDRRFVASQEVAEGLDDSVNLAAMDWEDFEHLIRELFEREFSGNGGEVRVTQASRDGGVDAIVFDPDPIRGGKIVIQAKRYTNVVGVSAVRDLFGTVMNEGANKGILVTTSHYGPDAYEFAKGKPLSLLDGGNLLHLLERHGHRAKIDIAEARKAIAGRGATK